LCFQFENIVIGSVADPHVDADPDPACHFDTAPDPDPTFQNLEKVLK
jgi:hypothetical protein